MPRHVVLGALLAACAATLAACSSNGSKSAAPTTAVAAPVATTAAVQAATTTAAAIDYKAQYLAIVAPANAALRTWRAALDKLGNDPAASDVARVTAPLITAYESTDNALLRAQWPANAEADIKNLVTTDGTLTGDLNAAGGQNVFSAASWESQVASDGGKAGAAANIVRADLGLPPPPS
jgi:hypothetical protein